jgi:predicted SAM-dependent methyltransferase
MFPDCKKIVHLFSGSLSEDVKGIRFDVNQDLNPDIVGDAHELFKYFESNSIDLIVADPPYSEEDALHYGTPLIKRNKVVKECYKILKLGGFLVWLDQAYPMYRKEELRLVGTIGIIRSTNHRFRVCLIWEKVK